MLPDVHSLQVIHNAGHYIHPRQYRNPRYDYRLIPSAIAVWAVAALMTLSPSKYLIGGIVIIGGGLCIVLQLCCSLHRNINDTRSVDLSTQSSTAFRSTGFRSTGFRSTGFQISIGYTCIIAYALCLLVICRSYHEQKKDCSTQLWQSKTLVTLEGKIAEDPINLANNDNKMIHFSADALTISGKKIHCTITAYLIFRDHDIAFPARWTKIAVVVRPIIHSHPMAQILRLEKLDKIIKKPNKLERCTNVIRENFHRATISSSSASQQLLPGFIMGDQRFISYKTKHEFIDAGLIHLMVFSGANFSIITAFFLSVLRSYRVNKKICAIASIAIIGAIVLIVGPGPSVLRAAIMGTMTAWGALSQRLRAPVGVLCMTVIALLEWDPSYATDLGFSLSVAATAGIIMGKETVANWYKFLLTHIKIPGCSVLITPLALSTSATVAVSPILIATGGKTGVSAVLTNVCVEPLMPLIVIPGVVIAFFSCVSIPIAALLIHLIDPIITLVDGISYYSAVIARNHTWFIMPIVVNFPVLVIVVGIIIYRIGAYFAR